MALSPYYIPMLVLVQVLLVWAKTRRLVNPVTILCVWWGTWLFVANFSFGGFYVPSLRTQGLFMAMFSAVVIGSLFAVSRRTPRERLNERIVAKWKWVYLLLWLVAPIICFYFVRALTTYLIDGLFGGGPGGLYRMQVFGIGEEESILFGNSYIQVIYVTFVGPLLNVGLIGGIALFLYRREIRLLMLALTLALFDAVMMLGRFPIYIIIVLLGFGLLVAYQAREKKPLDRRTARMRRRGRFAVALGCGAIVFFMYQISASRLHDRVDTGMLAEAIFKRYVINYHTLGFVILDREMQNDDSPLHTEVTYGRSLLGALEQNAVTVLRRFDSSLMAASRKTGAYMSVPRRVGVSEEGLPLEFNAYNTVLYTLYQDGRLFFVVLFPMWFGFLITSYYLRWLHARDLHSLMLLLFFFFVGFFSIFNSPVEGGRFWPVLMMIWFVNRIRLPVFRVRLFEAPNRSESVLPA